jgi:hypothetical protein
MDSPSFLITLRDGFRFVFITKVAQRIGRIQRKQRGLKSRDRIRRAQFDGRLKTRTKRDNFHDSDGRTRIVHFRFPNPIQRAGSGIGKSHPFVRSAPSFRPDLRTASAVARSGGQGWPVFGPPRQRRVASLTAASTAARSVASGTDPHHSVHQKAPTNHHQKPRSRLMRHERN